MWDSPALLPHPLSNLLACWLALAPWPRATEAIATLQLSTVAGGSGGWQPKEGRSRRWLEIALNWPYGSDGEPFRDGVPKLQPKTHLFIAKCHHCN